MGCGASKRSSQVDVATPIAEKDVVQEAHNTGEKTPHGIQSSPVQEVHIVPNSAKPRYEHEQATTTAALAHLEARPASENEAVGSEGAPEETPLKRVCVLGGGAFGTALSLVMAKKGAEVRVFDKPPSGAERQAKACNVDRENKAFLPGYTFPDNIWWYHEAAKALEGAELVLFVIPVPFLRRFCEKDGRSIPKGVPLVLCGRGMESSTLQTPSEVIAETLGAEYMKDVVVMSGPSVATELAAGQPSNMVVAGKDLGLVHRVQGQLSCRKANFRVSASDDPIGCEVAGAVKQVLAVAAGCAEGVGLGHSARAALSDQARVEMARLASAMGSNGRAMEGVAGAGDLLALSSVELGRSFSAGQRIAEGDITEDDMLAANEKLDNVQAPHSKSAEGVALAKTVHLLAERRGVAMPLCEAMFQICFHHAPVAATLDALPAPGPSSPRVAAPASAC